MSEALPALGLAERTIAVAVSVLYPDDRSEIAFAEHLATTGGGRCRGLR